MVFKKKVINGAWQFITFYNIYAILLLFLQIDSYIEIFHR